MTFPWWIPFIQVVLAGEEVSWTRVVPRGRAGRAYGADRIGVLDRQPTKGSTQGR
jgi:hypothetical protein